MLAEKDLSHVVILWDLDGVIVDGEEPFWQGVIHAFSDLLPELRDTDLREQLALLPKQVRTKNFTDFENHVALAKRLREIITGRSTVEIYNEIVSAYFHKGALESFSAKVKAYNEQYTEELGENYLIKKTADCFIEAARQGISMAIVTGSMREIAEHAKQLIASLVKDEPEIRDFILAVPTFTSGVYPRGKPHPDPYLMAKEHFSKQANTPSHYIIFEDSVSGTRAAVASNCYTVVVTDFSNQAYFQRLQDCNPDKLVEEITFSIIREFANSTSQCELPPVTQTLQRGFFSTQQDMRTETDESNYPVSKGVTSGPS